MFVLFVAFCWKDVERAMFSAALEKMQAANARRSSHRGRRTGLRLHFRRHFAPALQARLELFWPYMTSRYRELTSGLSP
jgi:hypothetical protein